MSKLESPATYTAIGHGCIKRSEEAAMHNSEWTLLDHDLFTRALRDERLFVDKAWEAVVKNLRAENKALKKRLGDTE